MQRHREVAGSPLRSSSDTWGVITQLVIDTVTRSSAITEAEVATSMRAASPAGMMLIAAGHLENAPMILVAGDLRLAITTVSGDKAFTVDENLNPVPGAASATNWTLHLPTPEPVGASVAGLIAGVAHLSSAPAPADNSAAELAATPAALDLTALARRREGR